MEKKNVLFVVNSYKIGGTAVSTRNVISLLDLQKFNHSVFVINDRGALKCLYEKCDVVPTTYWARRMMTQSWREETGVVDKLAGMVALFVKRKCPAIKKKMYKSIADRCLSGRHFDVVVACKGGPETDFVEMVDCPRKVVWVRNDFVNRHSKRQIEMMRSQYQKFDSVICVSEKVMDGFLSAYPEFAPKTICVYNPQNVDLLRERAELDDHDVRFKTDKICIVSVGRISDVKRFSKIPVIALELRNKGFDFRWYIIGDGDDDEVHLIRDGIAKYNLHDNVIMLGAKTNVHYYIKKADVLVSTSVSEACPRVVNEAKVLGTPVVSADYRTIFEFIENRKNGMIADIDHISDALAEMLTDKILYESILNELSSFEFDNTDLMEKIERALCGNNNCNG